MEKVTVAEMLELIAPMSAHHDRAFCHQCVVAQYRAGVAIGACDDVAVRWRWTNGPEKISIELPDYVPRNACACLYSAAQHGLAALLSGGLFDDDAGGVDLIETMLRLAFSQPGLALTIVVRSHEQPPWLPQRKLS